MTLGTIILLSDDQNVYTVSDFINLIQKILESEDINRPQNLIIVSDLTGFIVEFQRTKIGKTLNVGVKLGKETQIQHEDNF